MKRLILPILAALSPLALTAGTFSFETTGVNDLAHGQAAVWGLGGGSYSSTSMTYYRSMLTALQGTNQHITSVTLKLYDPSDWKDEPKDVLYVNILRGLDLDAGVDKYTYDSNPPQTDTSYGTNVFDNSSGAKNDKAHYNNNLKFDDAQAGSLLKSTNADQPANMPGTWTDTSGPYGQNKGNSDVTITLTAANIALLEQYLRADIAENTNGDSWMVGLGFAAECHYYFDKVKLMINIGTLPPPPPPPPPHVPDSGSTLALMALAFAGLVGLRRRGAK